MSNFDGIRKLNETFKMEVTTKDNINWDVIENQKEIIMSEVNEMLTSIVENDWEHLKDDVGDILTTVYGLAHRMNIDANKLMDNVTASNMSKVCYTIDQMLATMDHYQNLGVDVYSEPTTVDGQEAYIVKSSKDQVVNINGEDVDFIRGKFLKCIDWYEPDLNVEM